MMESWVALSRDSRQRLIISDGGERRGAKRLLTVQHGEHIGGRKRQRAPRLENPATCDQLFADSGCKQLQSIVNRGGCPAVRQHGRAGAGRGHVSDRAYWACLERILAKREFAAERLCNLEPP